MPSDDAAVHSDDGVVEDREELDGVCVIDGFPDDGTSSLARLALSSEPGAELNPDNWVALPG